jgi:RNase adaptor protein for sRNA GlmZ degradation
MAKKNELLSSFASSRKKTALAADDIDRIAEGIEEPKTVIAPKQVVQDDTEKWIKTSLDFPESLYEDMKISLIKNKKKQSMKEYILDLVRQDLYGKK